MSYSQWINLFIILGLINYSYEFNLRNNHIRRRTRETELKADTQQLLNKVIDDQDKFEDKIRESVRKDEDSVKGITRNILVAANEMAEAGASDIRNAEHWTKIQSELRNGINVIIEAYRRYIDLHRQACENIENYADKMITKYETELSTLDRLSVPTSPSGIIDTNNPRWADLTDKFSRMMEYTRIHEATLGTAADCVGDLTKRTLEHQEAIMGPSSNTVVVRIAQPANAEYVDPGLSLPCNAVSGYNGCQSCSNAIADVTQRYACSMSPSPCGQNLNVY
jgi:hypothetical protein